MAHSTSSDYLIACNENSGACPYRQPVSKQAKMPWNDLLDTFPATYAAPPTFDDPAFQSKDLPSLPHLRIAPLRNPIPPGSRKIPAPLEPATTARRESVVSKSATFPSVNLPAELPTLEEFLNAARRDNGSSRVLGAGPNTEQPLRTIFPGFINLRAVEKFPYPPFPDDAPRKRRRLGSLGDNFGELLQLPIPKAQKDIPKRRPFGPLPILNELKEPPPNAALFPPIEAGRRPKFMNQPGKDTSTSADHTLHGQTIERRAQRIEDLIELNNENEETELGKQEDGNVRETDGTKLLSHPQQSTQEANDLLSQKETIRPKKKLRRWSEQETYDLLRGVVRCGVGNWTSILTQPDLKFNKRTAANLKDRFRVCCPWAYETGQSSNTDDIQSRLADSINNAQSGLVGKILLPDPRTAKIGAEYKKGTTKTSFSAAKVHSRGTGSGAKDPDNQPGRSKQKRVSGMNGSQELSNRSKSTLISLGLEDPDTAVKSNRRQRRPFTEAEDEALLKGYAVHGFQWTLIRQDKHLNLLHRKATDLRDRFRTKFPSVYREGGFATVKNIDSNIRDGRSPAATVEGTKPGFASASKHSGIELMEIPISATGATAVPIDPAMSPPAPPSSLPEPPNVPVTPLLSFSIDDGGHAAEETNFAVRWAENTLPPLIWDELV